MNIGARAGKHSIMSEFSGKVFGAEQEDPNSDAIGGALQALLVLQGRVSTNNVIKVIEYSIQS